MYRIDLFCRFRNVPGSLGRAVERLEAVLKARFGPVTVGYNELPTSTITVSYASWENKAETMRQLKKFLRRNDGKVGVFRIKRVEIFEDGIYDITLDSPSLQVIRSRSKEEGET